ncbi:MAG: hypothetical protein EBV19_10640, partial [Flavobacteriia bacterium]|nr:hypothetical protein [Flavobacteriia bacterium]
MKNISLTYLLFCLGLLTLLIVSNDNFLSILPIYHGSKFQDLRYIFEYGDCLNKISNNNCTFYENHPFVYPQIWLLISKYINLFYGTIFYLLFVFLYLIISIVTFKDINKKYIYHFLFFFSPASVLLIIRANNDIIIFILTYLLIILLKNNKFRFISFALFIFSYLLKIYSIFLILIFFLKKKDFNIKNYLLLLIFIILTYFFINEILAINKIYNKSKLVAAYSSGQIFDLFNYLNFRIKINTELFSRISLLIIIALSFSKLNKINSNISKENYLLFISGAIILVTSFFLSRTFDYKLIFILLIIPAIFEIKKRENSYLINIIIFCIFLIIWFEAIIFYYS